MGQLGNLIRDARTRQGITQDVLATQLGYTSAGQFVSNIERGYSSIPLSRVNKLARLLKISPDDIIEAKLADTRDRFRRKVKSGGSKTRVSRVGM